MKKQKEKKVYLYSFWIDDDEENEIEWVPGMQGSGSKTRTPQ